MNDDSFIGSDIEDGAEYLGTMEFTGETVNLRESATLTHDAKSEDK